VTIATAVCNRCNLLLFTIDTLRSDRVGAFGGDANLTPNLDRLASHGLRLTRAYAPAPLTLPSHSSIMTAAYPPAHGVRTNGLFRLGSDRPTLATVLHAAGYRTGAFVGAFVLDARFGLNRGFDVYDDRYGDQHLVGSTEGAERRAEDVVTPALAWILNGSQGAESPLAAESRIPNPESPWFAWVHLYDPHEPYNAPAGYASRFAPYDAEVAYVDAQVGRLLTALQNAGALDRTLVVVAADHGESLGEHGERTHGVFVYDATMRVPWMLWAGSRLQGASDALVSLTSLAPTALDLLGIAAPKEFEAVSAIPFIRGERDSPPPYIEAMDANLTRNWAPLTGIVSGHYKLIDLPVPELYDLAADPKETTNLFSRDGERARTLDALRRGAIAAFGAGSATPAVLSAESRQRLQALGYVASSAAPAARVYKDADDPKALIGPANELNDAIAEFRRGSYDAAAARVGAIIDRYPAFATAYGVFASMQHDVGDVRGAIATLELLVRRETADQSVLVVLAGYLMEAGQLEKSAALLETVVASHPDYADAYNSLGTVNSRLGRHDGAQAAFRKVLDLDPTSATAYENLGVDEFRSGDLDRAVVDLQRALELDPKLASAHNAIAAVYMKRRQPSDAVAHWRTAIDLDPRLFDALYNLGIALHDGGRREEARPFLERFVRDAPPARYAADIEHLRRLLAGSAR
jgi:arylsulfatase A-like enzyme/Tfp pilus assembly protein PilF